MIVTPMSGLQQASSVLGNLPLEKHKTTDERKPQKSKVPDKIKVTFFCIVLHSYMFKHSNTKNSSQL